MFDTPVLKELAAQCTFTDVKNDTKLPFGAGFKVTAHASIRCTEATMVRSTAVADQFRLSHAFKDLNLRAM